LPGSAVNNQVISTVSLRPLFMEENIGGRESGKYAPHFGAHFQPPTSSLRQTSQLEDSCATKSYYMQAAHTLAEARRIYRGLALYCSSAAARHIAVHDSASGKSLNSALLLGCGEAWLKLEIGHYSSFGQQKISDDLIKCRIYSDDRTTAIRLQ